jgi:hypothetical protein
MLNIKRSTKRCESIKVFNRRARVVNTRRRIGHTHLTHCYQMNHLEPPRCNNSDILYDCGLFGAATLRERNMELTSPGKRRGEK